MRESKANPKIAILILSHNTSKYAIDCIDSIRRRTTYQNYEIILVENGSDPEHKNALKEKFDNGSLHFLDSETNLGYGGGMNHAMRFAMQRNYDYLVLLNDDTIVTQDNWLEEMLNPFRLYNNIGMVSPMTDYASHSHQDVAYFGGMPHGLYMDTHDLIYVCVMIPTTLVTEIGYFDDPFYVGAFADNDYSLRIKIAGYRLIVDGKVFIHHIGSVANKKLREKGFDYWDNLEKVKIIFAKKWGIENIDNHNWRAKFFDMSTSGQFLGKPDEVV